MLSHKSRAFDSAKAMERLLMGACILVLGALWMLTGWDLLDDPEARHRWLLGAPIVAGFMVLIALATAPFVLRTPREEGSVGQERAAGSSWFQLFMILLTLVFPFKGCQDLGRSVIEQGYMATLHSQVVYITVGVGIVMAVGVLGYIGSRRYR